MFCTVTYHGLDWLWQWLAAMGGVLTAIVLPVLVMEWDWRCRNKPKSTER